MDQTLYIGDVYEEKGATVPDGWVLRISGTVDTSTAGVYEITYYAFNPETGQNVTRTIHVAEGLNAPSSGPNNVNAEVNPPVEGPANLTAVNLTTNPPVEGPTNVTAVNLTINPPVEGPTNLTAVLETAPVKPAIGYPIVSSSGTSLAVKPAVGYPIVGKPAVGYPIDSVQL